MIAGKKAMLMVAVKTGGLNVMTEKQSAETEKKPMARVRYSDVLEFPTFSYFPKDKWEEYNEDVEKNYGGTRWAKAWNEHILVKQMQREEGLYTQIMALQVQLNSLQEQVN